MKYSGFKRLNVMKKIVVLLFILVLGLVGMNSLFHDGFYTSHDGWHQVARLYHFNEALIDGQFPPRWGGLLLNGFGYPLFFFSYHLPWWLGVIFLRLGFNIFDAIKAVFILTYLASGFTFYLFAKKFFGGSAGVVGALVYLFTPYRFAVILVRANIGEAVSFVFVPLIFLTLYELSDKFTLRWLLIGAVSIAGLILSHLMIAPLLLIPLLFCGLVFLRFARNKLHFLVSTLLFGFLGICLSSYYLIPAIFYQPQTVFKQVYEHLYETHFTPLSKLLYSPWGYGALGTSGEMSRQVGLVIWLVLFLSIVIVGWRFVKKKMDQHDVLTLIYISSFILSLVLMLPVSKVVWSYYSRYSVVDFPWRLLAITTFSGSFLSTYVISRIQPAKWQLIGIVLLSLAVFYTNRNHMRVNQYTKIPLSLYIDSELTTNTDDEYLPRGVDRGFSRKKEPVSLNKALAVKDVHIRTNRINFAYFVETDEKTDIFHLYFPGWIARLDGQVIPVHHGTQGNIQLDLLRGNHKVDIFFEGDLLVKIANYITLVTLIVMFSLLLYRGMLKTKR